MPIKHTIRTYPIITIKKYYPKKKNNWVCLFGNVFSLKGARKNSQNDVYGEVGGGGGGGGGEGGSRSLGTRTRVKKNPIICFLYEGPLL